MSKLKNGLDFFLYLVNEQSDHLVVNNGRRPWTPALQLHYRFFGG